MYARLAISKWAWVNTKQTWLGVIVKQIRNLFIVLAASLFLSGSLSAADIGPKLKINRSNGDKCVADTTVMRKNHMQFLLHQRDETMHKGVRTKKFSLNECVSCHANKDESGKYIPVTAKGEFCQSCHSYASVKLDCFECHATKPRDTAFHPIVNDNMKATQEMHGSTESKQLLDKMLAGDNSNNTDKLKGEAQ